MKNAIVCLARGHSNVNLYNNLLFRNDKIYELINKKVDNKYPLIIFHEGNIIQSHQEYIKSFGNNQNIIFIDISDVWIGGYHGMCRFYSYDIWNYCREFDYILRIDDDCFLSIVESDPFDYIQDKVFLKSASWPESHIPTNSTLPFIIENITGISHKEFYIHNFPYTNVCLSSVSFWLNSEINLILEKISKDPKQITNRWGDLPILGSLLNIFAKNRVGYFDKFEYTHSSHNNQKITC
jgi:hypothetical protein